MQSTFSVRVVHATELKHVAGGFGHTMGMDPAMRDLVGWIHKQSSARFHELHPDQRPRSKPHDIKASFVLGITSLVLATVVVCVTFMCLIKKPFPPLSEQREVISERMSSDPEKIDLPSFSCRMVACVAEGLGVAGLLLGGRRRISLFSLFGVLLAVASMVPVIGYELFLTLH